MKLLNAIQLLDVYVPSETDNAKSLISNILIFALPILIIIAIFLIVRNKKAKKSNQQNKKND